MTAFDTTLGVRLVTGETHLVRTELAAIVGFDRRELQKIIAEELSVSVMRVHCLFIGIRGGKHPANIAADSSRAQPAIPQTQ